MVNSLKLLILTILISLTTITCINAATFYSIAGGKWSNTSGGADCGCAPTGAATDDIIVDRNDCPSYDAVTGDPCEDQSASSCVILNFANFAGKLTIKNGGMLVLTGAINMASTANITVEAGGLLKVNGSFSWPGGPTPPTMQVDGVMHWRGSMSVYWPVTGTGFIKCCAAILIFSNGVNLWGSVFGLSSVTCPGTVGTAPTTPVTFSNIYASTSFNTIDIHWTTASEIDNDYFSIERSEDGDTFTSIGKVKGAGNSNTLLAYKYTDANPIRGKSNYYRIRQTDFNLNNSTTSSIISAELKKPAYTISIIPNPNDGIFSVHLSELVKGSYTLYISDLAGKILKTYQFTDVQNLDLDLNDLGSGIYELTIITQESTLHSNFHIIQ